MKALREFRRVLKEGGKTYLLDTCRDDSPLVSIYDCCHKIFVRDHVRYYHSKEVEEFFRSAGFSDVSIKFRVNKFFLHGKLLTSVVLITARKD